MNAGKERQRRREGRKARTKNRDQMLLMSVEEGPCREKRGQRELAKIPERTKPDKELDHVLNEALERHQEASRPRTQESDLVEQDKKLVCWDL